MSPLNLPPFDIKIVSLDGKQMVWDIIREKYVAFTPEENVRQHFVNYLIEQKNYPRALMANEITIRLKGMSKRCDTIIYDRSLNPRMIIEYKAPSIAISNKVLNQIVSYNIALRVDFLILSNGINHYCARLDYLKRTCMPLHEIPYFKEIIF